MEPSGLNKDLTFHKDDFVAPTPNLKISVNEVVDLEILVVVTPRV